MNKPEPGLMVEQLFKLTMHRGHISAELIGKDFNETRRQCLALLEAKELQDKEG